MKFDLDKIAGIKKEETETKKASKGRKVDMKVLRYDIDDDVDTELSVFTKQLINKHEITNKEVYDMFGRAEGWNMIYGLKKGSIGWDRVKKWCELMGYRIDIELTPIKKK